MIATWMLATLWMPQAQAATPTWSQLLAPDGWEEVARRDVSDVGEIVVEHKRIGDVHCIHGLVQVDVAPDKLLAAAMDVPSAPRWSSVELVFSEVLGKGDGYIDFWQYLDIPNWTLVSDRYWVLRGTPKHLEGGGKSFRWDRLSPAEAYPKLHERVMTYNSHAIEPPTNFGEWAFLPVNGKTEAHYRVCTDSGGSLPLSIQKWAAQRTLPDTVGDLVREGKRRAGAAKP